MTGPQTFDNAALSIYSQPTPPGPTANQIYRWVVCTGACNAFQTDALRAVAVATNSSTGVMAATTGYILNDDTNAFPLGQAAAVNGTAVGDVNGSATWLINGIGIDSRFVVPSTGTGRSLQSEVDYNITSPSTTGFGWGIGGTWVAQPAAFSALFIETPWGTSYSGPSAPFAKFSYGVFENQGCCIIAMSVPQIAFTLTANMPSAPVSFNWQDNANVTQNTTLAGGSGFLTIGGSAGGGWGIQTADNSVSNPNAFSAGICGPASANQPSCRILWNYRDAANVRQNYAWSVDNTGFFFLGGSAAPSAQKVQIQAQAIQIPNIPQSGTANGSLCIDIAGNIFQKTTTGACK